MLFGGVLLTSDSSDSDEDEEDPDESWTSDGTSDDDVTLALAEEANAWG